jgi:putative transcriptional regulator
MSKTAYGKIMAGLQDALAFAKGDASRGMAHVPGTDVKSARKRLGMTQKTFAENFGVSVETVRNWEQGRRRPDGPARVLLAVIDHNPEAVLDALRRVA